MTQVNIEEELNMLVSAVLIGQGKGCYTLEQAEQLCQCMKSLKNKLNPPPPPKPLKRDLLGIDEDLELA